MQRAIHGWINIMRFLSERFSLFAICFYLLFIFHFNLYNNTILFKSKWEIPFHFKWAGRHCPLEHTQQTTLQGMVGSYDGVECTTGCNYPFELAGFYLFGDWGMVYIVKINGNSVWMKDRGCCAHSHLELFLYLHTWAALQDYES